MGWRFRKSMRIAPGVRLNLSKSGPGLSFGRRGFRTSVGPSGRRTTFSLPGTGLSYVTQSGRRRRATGRAGGCGCLGCLGVLGGALSLGVLGGALSLAAAGVWAGRRAGRRP